MLLQSLFCSTAGNLEWFRDRKVSRKGRDRVTFSIITSSSHLCTGRVDFCMSNKCIRQKYERTHNNMYACNCKTTWTREIWKFSQICRCARTQKHVKIGGWTVKQTDVPVLENSESSFMSHDMKFSTMWYVRPEKPQISLRIRVV